MIKNADQIRAESNITDIIGKYVTLKRRGVTFVGLCPFHSENTPSFTVNPARNTFKCFGCGVGGDAIHFLMEHEGMTYPEALEAAAAEARIDIEYENRERRQEDIDRAKKEKERRTTLADTLQSVHRFYVDKGSLTGVYCDLETRTELVDADGRQIKRTTADTFGMCLTPDDNLVRKAGFWDTPLLEDIGILGKGNYGEYDFFRRRLLFRITDHTGRITALAGRRLREEDTEKPSLEGGKGGEKQRAKYINSKESILYNKSETLFGLFENRRGIKDAGHAILVEGYFDVITPHDHGICNCVAPCGTALTDAQAKLLKRYTDEVVILRDGDQAGLEAAKRDVETLVRAGHKVRICQMKPGADLIKSMLQQKDHLSAQQKEVEKWTKLDPIDKKMKKERENAEALLATMRENMARMEADYAALKDPDTFIRRHGKKGFYLFIEETSQDAIIWRVLEDYDPGDVFSKERATQVAGVLLALIESETLRDFYVRELCKPANLGSIKAILSQSVKVHTDSKGKKSDLTPKQKQDVANYGIFERDHNYFIAHDVNSSGWSVSNFTIKPIIFIEGQRESIRLVEITNERGIARILDINSRNFVELGPFKQTIEARGNYRFEGKPEHFAKVKAKVYDEMRTAFPIYTLGLHREGFFTFANGIVNEGKFSPVDEYGLVSFDDTKYYLPAFSKIRDHVKSDDVDNDYQDEQYYVYTSGDPGLTFRDWTALMREVHSDNAVIGILYLCSCFIREKIYERLDNMFPHLNFFGLPGSGKNQLAASLTAVFGKYRQPVHIVNATDAAFFRRIAQVRNGLAWYDEYSNNAEYKRVDALKQFADGTGRSRATLDNPNRTTSSAVVAGCIVSGQQQPTADIALFTRCISLNFHVTEFDVAAKDRHARLKKIEQDGRLTAFTALLHSHRPAMLEHFALEFEAAYSRIQQLVAGNIVMDRILRSYAAMLTTYRLLARVSTTASGGGGVEFAFSEEEVEQILVASILTQRESVYQENEVSIWWRMVEFFLANGEIEHGADILVEEVQDETFDLDWQGKNKEPKAYRPAKRLLYIYIARAHPLYLERHQRQRNAKGLDVEALKYYLKSSAAWEGFKRAKKFQGQVKACLVFDCEKLPFELEDTVAVTARKARRITDEDDKNEPPAPTGAEIKKMQDQQAVTVPPPADPDELPF